MKNTYARSIAATPSRHRLIGAALTSGALLVSCIESEEDLIADSVVTVETTFVTDAGDAGDETAAVDDDDDASLPLSADRADLPPFVPYEAIVKFRETESSRARTDLMAREASPLVCKSELDCAGPCKCQQGVCKLPDFGPFPPSCEPPPRDLFEVDDTWQQWKAYGEPQVHNFHHAGDNDWVAVYFGGAGTARFRTHDLAWNTDTKLEVYKYTANGKGALVGTHDDIGGSPYLPESKASRLDMSVPANSAYLVRVINKTPAWFYEQSSSFPTYTLSITYL
jgi:hypothetical protein